MSFSSDLKSELSGIVGGRHCQAAQLRAILTMCGGVSVSAFDRIKIRIQTENKYVVRSFALLVRRILKSECEVSVRCRKKSQKNQYIACIPNHEDAARLLLVVGLLASEKDGAEAIDGAPPELSDPILKKNCCRRAYLRGAFLASGSISDPSRFYHLEMVADQEAKAQQLGQLIRSFGMEPGMVQRKGKYVVYIKDSESIGDMIGQMEGTKALLNYENIRILREISGSINRQVNCETANINKTVGAAVKQIRDIEFIRDKIGIDRLPKNLQQMARLRLSEPEMPLKDLGQQLDPPLGKSGVNHRLRKLSEIADKLRED